MKVWIARDKDEGLYVYLKKPNKGKAFWKTINTHETMEIKPQCLPKGVNPQWVDVEPIEVNLKIERVKK